MKQNTQNCIINEMTINQTVREALALALLKLMEKQEFDKISITEITKVAGVGRSSFYRNFESKESLLCDYILTLYKTYFDAENVPHSINHSKNIESFLIPRFEFIYKYRKIFSALHKRNILYYFFNKIEQDFILVLCGQSDDISSYYCAMFAGSCASIIRHWIERDFKESVEDMVEVFKNPPVLNLNTK